jgi:exosortase
MASLKRKRSIEVKSEPLNSAVRRVQLILAVALLFLGFVLFQFFGNATRGYIDTPSLFYWWGSQWFNAGSEAEHGPIILGLSGWILWRNLQRAGTRTMRPRLFAGLAWIAAGIALHVIGYLVQQTRISIAAALLYVIGVAYLAGGEKWGRATVFPAIFMLFSIPLSMLTDILGFYLRMGVISVAHTLAHGIGIDVVRAGTQLFAPDRSFQYDVAPACSGIRSLIALSALSLLIGYLSFRSWWRPGLLLSLSLPYAFLGNVIRIFSIILAAELLGQDAGNFVHEWFGFIVFIIVLGLALLTVRVMEKWIPERDDEAVRESESRGATEADANIGNGTAGRRAWAALLPVVLGGAAAVYAIHSIDGIKTSDQCGVFLSPNSNDPVSLPKMLNIEWLGSDQAVTKVEREILPSDTGFSRKIYQNILGHDVLVSIVLSGKDRSSIHRPEICLVAQGWTVKGNSIHQFPIPAFEGGNLKTTLLRTEFTIDREGGGQMVIPGLFAYWFVGGDVVVATHWERMAQIAKDRLFGLKTHRWAYVFAQTTTLDGAEAGFERLNEVIALAVPVFQKVGTTAE